MEPPAFDSVFVDEEEANFIAAQWKYVIRTNNITPSFTAEKLLTSLFKLQRTDNASLKMQVIDLDANLDLLLLDIQKHESEMNLLVYSLYDLSLEEIRQVEMG